MICAACLGRADGASGRRASRLGTARRLAGTLVAAFVAWLCFLGVGRLLLSLPESVHEGTLWTSPDAAEDGR